ncbi:MAG: hypothetical protein HYT08_01475 [Candidatus Levybacteria bacterium]|nr:hypothetical protein [Candidatus Levybacteria bacterium]
MRWILRSFLLSIMFLFFFYSPIFAQSSYVLPYPSFMPGSPFYKINLIKDKILKYWYFGKFGQFNYNLKQADKYLVEAKTLFEYDQFLLGQKALKKSDEYFYNIRSNLDNSKANKESIDSKRTLLKEASLKHIEALLMLREGIPEKVYWRPEKSFSTKIYLKKDIEMSISIRRKNL